MQTLNLAKIGGFAAAVGGALWSVKVLVDGPEAQDAGVGDPLMFLLPLLFAAGLYGLYARYGEEMQGRGVAGFTQSFAGLALLAGGLFADLTLGTEGAVRIVSFGFIILTLGLIILGFATLRTEPLPAGNFLPLALGMLTPLNIIVGEFPLLRLVISVLFGIGWLALGILVLNDGRTERAK